MTAETTEQQTEGPGGESPRWLRRSLRGTIVPLVAVLLALLIGAIILALSGANPFEAYGALIQGGFGSPTAVQRTLEKATPLIFTGLAVAFAFKGGLFNIGAQGQLLIGGVIAAAAGFGISGLPAIIHAPLALFAGALAGALYGAIPGFLKARTGAHEVITTIMLNFVAINITDYLADGVWKDTSYEIRTVGLNSNAAKYAGMGVAYTIILTMTISGFLAGMGGSIETLGVVGRYQPGFNIGLGFDGITVALLGKTHPFGVIPAAILIGALRAGSSQMQFSAGVAKEITDVIIALMLFFVAADQIVRWILRGRLPEEEEKITVSTSWGQ